MWTDIFNIICHTNRYLWYDLTCKQIALVINNYFKFDTATGKLVNQREQFCFCTYTYWHHLENLSYQTDIKLWALKSSCKGTFSTKWLSETIVMCGVLRVKLSSNHSFPSVSLEWLSLEVVAMSGRLLHPIESLSSMSILWLESMTCISLYLF